ncbi:hypothetical protein HD806DRAFT_547282 [Xylariaceae sp. AK1471]|nr:hypothetical protein HD806DRAFT_547282 [Xylariaceae sp. AK1471]
MSREYKELLKPVPVLPERVITDSSELKSLSRYREVELTSTALTPGIFIDHLAKQLDFKFPKTNRDNARAPVLDEHRGRAHAGHVEILLACWFVVKILRDHFNLVNEPEEILIPQLRRLRDTNLGDKRTAFITIDSEPCRTCLQFINKVSQYTGIIFVVIGSQGVGPIQVRLDGQRRRDIVGEVFLDSEDELLDEEANERQNEGTESSDAVIRDTPLPSPVQAPTTPGTRSLLQRPRTSWKETFMPWTAQNPEDLLSSYKKKTPVYEFPGYKGVPRPKLTTPVGDERELETRPSNQTPAQLISTITDSDYEVIDENMTEFEEYWQTNSPGSRLPKLISSVEKDSGMPTSDTRADDLGEWEDLGDGIMIRCADVTDANQESHSPRYKRPDSRQSSLPMYTGNSHGVNYARAAYEAVRDTVEIEEIEWDAIQRPQLKDRHIENFHTRHRRNLRKMEANRQRAPTGASSLRRLEDFRHQPDIKEDESVFKNKYSILRPKHSRF